MAPTADTTGDGDIPHMRWGEYQVCRGEVERVDAGGVTVRFRAHGQLGEQCAGCRACGMGRPESRLRIPRDEARSLVSGQTVEVRRFVMDPALAAAIVFGLPLALMLAGLAAATALLPHSARSPALPLWAVAGLAIGVVLARLVDLAVCRRAGLPRIVDPTAGSEADALP
jgi:positive regulator of sigma E activity